MSADARIWTPAQLERVYGAPETLADNECEHGRLAGDASEPCGCYPSEHVHERQLSLLEHEHE